MIYLQIAIIIIVTIAFVTIIGAAYILRQVENVQAAAREIEQKSINMLPQDVYRLTAYGKNELAYELAHYQMGSIIEVGAMSAILDEWCVEVLAIEEDGTVIIHDTHNFLNENFICSHYASMVKHEAHYCFKHEVPEVAPLVISEDEPNMDVPF